MGKGNPIIVTGGSTWVTTGDVTLHISEAIWHNIGTDGDQIILSRNATIATAAYSNQLVNRGGYKDIPMTIWGQKKVLSKLYVHTLESGKLEIWLD